MLVSFLVLVLVALATLTRVETQVATNSQKQDLARHNALTALNIALGELQRFTGPDQRVTAPADLLANLDHKGNATASPAALPVQAGTRRWTGVWGNNTPSIGYTLRPNEIVGRGVSPQLMNWLVSGNEQVTYTQAANGRVTNVTGISYTPTSEVVLDDLSAPTIDGAPAVLLVGPGSIGAGSTSDYVAAPLSQLTVPATLIPGADPAAGNVPTGHYAWWVGDEGVKARIDLQNGYQDPNVGDAAAAAKAQVNSFRLSQRDAVEFVDDANDTPLGAAAYNFADSRIHRLQALHQLPYLAADSAGATRLRNTGKSRFHDLTAHSSGVLADSYAGGLKKNLTADVLDTSTDHSYRPDDSAPIFPLISSASNEPLMPTWGVLRSWARTHPDPDDSNKIKPTVASETEAGIAPVITSASLGLNYYLEGPNDTFVMALFPMVVLFNPYPYTLSLKDTEFDIAFRVNGPGKILVRVDPAGGTSFSSFAIFNLETASIYKNGVIPVPANSYFRFRVKGSDLPPGESHIYCLPDTPSPTNYDALGGLPLERAPDSDGIGIGNFVKLIGPDLASSGLALTGNSTIQLRTTDFNSARTVVDFVLAEQGALAAGLNPATTSKWFQRVTNSLSRNCALVANTLCDLDNSYSTLNNRRGIAGYAPFSNATSALRLTAYTEMLDTWLAYDRWGFTATKIRFHAACDFRAPIIEPTIYERDNQPDTRINVGATIMGSGLIGADSDRNKTDNPHLNFTNNRYAMNYGQSLNASANPNSSLGLHHSVFFDILATPDQLLSLGQLQNAPFSRYSFQPAYPFGNSYADPRIARDKTYRDNIVRPVAGGSANLPAYDLSWLLNRSLWDRYFLTGVPGGWTQSDLDANRPLPNSRMKLRRVDSGSPDLSSVKSGADAYDKAATHFMVDGSFNINSTSEQAWRAVLAGTYGISAKDAEAYAEAADLVDQIIPFPRFSHNIAKMVQANTPYPAVTQTMVSTSPVSLANFYKTAFLGNRGLYLGQPDKLTENASPEAAVTELARSIVAEIRKRGPFLSLADFINRPLTPSNNILGVKGPLQAGIDGMKYEAAQANAYTWTSRESGSGLFIGSATASAFGQPPDWDPEHTVGGPEADFHTPADPYQIQIAMAPFFLTQADILSTLGPRLSARSDTFLIRTYGDTLNPATGDVDARAWCEAVVQRLPDYVDPSVNPLPEKAATGINTTLGRRYRVVSLRWLSPEEI